MQIRVLGPVEIHDETRGRRIAVSGLKRPALLATLVVRAGRTVSMDRLIQEISGEDPPANAANALQAHIKRLRRLIGSACGQPDRIVTRAPGYSLILGPGETDAEQFGAQLDGCVLGDICRTEAVVLEENRCNALEALYDACLRANRHEEILAELEETASAYPLRERIADQLMVALYRANRQSEAIGVYDRMLCLTARARKLACAARGP